MPPTWFTHPESGLSTEPDGFAVRWETHLAERFRPNPACRSEWLGRPDMVLEVVSASSKKKDLEELPGDYARAGVEEYWIADARAGEPRLRIRVLDQGRYREEAADEAGWIRSPFWGRAFRIVRFTNRAGLAGFRLEALP